MRWTGPIVVAVLIGCPEPATAQIVNTLRGFDRQAPGWSGGVEALVAIADGNTNYLEYVGSGSVQYLTQHDRWIVLGRYMRRSADEELIAENRMTHLRHNHRFKPWLASVLFVQGQHDPFRRTETRLLAGGGARFDVLRRETWEGALGATWMSDSEELTDDDHGYVTRQRFSFFASVSSAASEGVQVDLVTFYQPRVDDPGDVRAFTAASVEVDITGGLYVLLRYDLVHDSHPPSGVRKTDQTLRSGFGFKL